MFAVKSLRRGLLQPLTQRYYGGLKDQDRIFTNVYNDNDPFIEGAMKRVSK